MYMMALRGDTYLVSIIPRVMAGFVWPPDTREKEEESMAMARPADTAVLVWYVCSVAEVPTFRTAGRIRRRKKQL